METKSKILYLYRILSEQTDEQHPLSTNQIIDKLGEMGIGVTRKTVASDIALLQEFGVDVISVRSSQNLYYIGDRVFELPEVKLLVDAVESSKLITIKKSKTLVDKISKFVSKEQAKELNRNIFIDKRVKPKNENIYYTIDLVHTAINDKIQIDFKYIDYTGEKEVIYKHESMTYKVSPYALAWNDDHYYLIGYCSNHKKISKFRVDRMAKVELSDRVYVNAPEDFSAAEYVKSIFDMYDGPISKVEIKCTNDLMKIIVDKFGEEVETISLGSNCFKATVEVSVSPTFFSWLFGFGTKMSILAPTTVKEQYKEMLTVILNNSI